jgi:hypothetical protein
MMTFVGRNSSTNFDHAHQWQQFSSYDQEQSMFKENCPRQFELIKTMQQEYTNDRHDERTTSTSTASAGGNDDDDDDDDDDEGGDDDGEDDARRNEYCQICGDVASGWHCG